MFVLKVFKITPTGVEALLHCRSVTFVTCDEVWERVRHLENAPYGGVFVRIETICLETVGSISEA